MGYAPPSRLQLFCSPYRQLLSYLGTLQVPWPRATMHAFPTHRGILGFVCVCVRVCVCVCFFLKLQIFKRSGLSGIILLTTTLEGASRAWSGSLPGHFIGSGRARLPAATIASTALWVSLREAGSHSPHWYSCYFVFFGGRTNPKVH